MRAMSTLAALFTAAALGAAAASGKTLPFTTLASGQAAPAAAPLRPQAFVSVDRAFIYVFAYGGRFPTHDYALAVTSVALSHGVLVVRASWGFPPMPFLVHPGEAVPFQVLRIPRRAVGDRAPRSALLVQVHSGVRPHMSLAALLSRVSNAATRLRSATLFGIADAIPLSWPFGGAVLPGATWFLTMDGNAACGNRNAPTGFYVMEDRTGQIFGCGVP